jgi:hypothetical protein
VRDKHWEFLIFNPGLGVQILRTIVLGAVEGIWDSNMGNRHRGSRGVWVALMCIYFIYLGNNIFTESGFGQQSAN